MEKDAAIQKITELVLSLSPQVDASRLNFFATKLVLDVLDYCHRDDFPETLCYTLAAMLSKQLDAAEDSSGTGGAPLKSLTQDDTKFEWAVGEVDTSVDAGLQIFNALKPRLALYRRVVGL